METRAWLSGNEAVAAGALDAGVTLGTGYPGTPSSEILEALAEFGGTAQWAPNEKVALEVALGVSTGGARGLATMKHVGLNVAADPLFSATHIGATGGLVLAVADDPGMASSQNEQDTRRYAVAAGAPVFEPSDSQEAYAMTRAAFALSEKWRLPFIIRLTTRICHSRTLVERDEPERAPLLGYERQINERVMVPAYARPAHKRLRSKLQSVAEWNNLHGMHRYWKGTGSLGVITSGVATMHVREAAPEASILQIGMTHPLPMRRIMAFLDGVEECVVIEEGDPVLFEALRAAGRPVRGRPDVFRFGELNVDRVRRIIDGETQEPPAETGGKPPQLCPGCPHRAVFQVLSEKACFVTGDIGCYSLGVLPPYEAMDTCACMGASIGMGLGMRRALPDEDARRVVSVIGDSTFVHSGLTGIVDMVYNRPRTGHVVLILDNATTAMTGLQEHPGTGRALDGTPAPKLELERVVEAMGVDRVVILNPSKETDRLRDELTRALASNELTVIITRQPCVLAMKRDRKKESG
ncbi:thiamine pyrophosphate-dependent enzyme [Kiritimatiella glycovorans]|uniref:Indolepyruvate oxidoreductase subunit IorA n=1 Tax=Kiritimatiella glycovorans TaxID=1307763 RepID=A0A0G3EI53_9BACT|nr:thiamine pyrophosphate-dependent enzyme [Kiritimatiella glycovorans]AKJ63809.1 indolepyruvate ferredoxin oxidoreductase [Kiritimatiella glycovorans]